MSSPSSLPISSLPSKFSWADDEDEEFDLDAWKATADIAAPAASSLPPLQVTPAQQAEPAYIATITTTATTNAEPGLASEAESASSTSVESNESYWTPDAAQRCLSWRAVSDDLPTTPAYPEMSWYTDTRKDYSAGWKQMKVRTGVDCRFPVQFRASNLSIVRMYDDEEIDMATDAPQEEVENSLAAVVDLASAKDININFIQEDELAIDENLARDDASDESAEETDLAIIEDIRTYVDQDDELDNKSSARVIKINFIQHNELGIYDLDQDVITEEFGNLPAAAIDLTPVEDIKAFIDEDEDLDHEIGLSRAEDIMANIDQVEDADNEDSLASAEGLETGLAQDEALGNEDDLSPVEKLETLPTEAVDFALVEEIETSLVQEESTNKEDLAPFEELESSLETTDLAPEDPNEELENSPTEVIDLAPTKWITAIDSADEEDWNDITSDSELGVSTGPSTEQSRSTTPDSGYTSDEAQVAKQADLDASSTPTKTDYTMPEKTPLGAPRSTKLAQETTTDTDNCNDCLPLLSSSWPSLSNTTLTSIGLGVLSAGALALWLARYRR